MMGLFDEKFKKHKARYSLQCLLATISALVALMVLDGIANAAVIGALGASAFIIFTMPHRHVSDARFLVGGYLVGIAAGTLCYWSSRLILWNSCLAIDQSRIVIFFFAALAVGGAIFLMVITNTEHPPAAGLAMGLVLYDWNLQAILVVLVGIAYLAGMKRWLKPFMIDLL